MRNLGLASKITIFLCSHSNRGLTWCPKKQTDHAPHKAFIVRLGASGIWSRSLLPLAKNQWENCWSSSAIRYITAEIFWTRADKKEPIPFLMHTETGLLSPPSRNARLKSVLARFFPLKEKEKRTRELVLPRWKGPNSQSYPFHMQEFRAPSDAAIGTVREKCLAYYDARRTMRSVDSVDETGRER